MSLPRVEQLHAGLSDLIRERLAIEPVILGARCGMGSEDLAAVLVAELGGFMLDALTGDGDDRLLIKDLSMQVIEHAAGLPLEALRHGDRAAERARVALAGRYGSDLAAALEAGTGGRTNDLAEDWTLARALGAEQPGRLLAIRDAHRLGSTTMWQLRELAADGASILLLTTPEHRKRLHARDAPFYGTSAYVEQPTLGVPRWTAAIGPQVDPERLIELLRHTRFRTAITLSILDRHLRRRSPDIGDDWAWAVDAHDAEARTVLALAPRIHDLAPRLLLALAFDEPPYGRTAERSDRIALALRRLRENDLIEQPEPRQWQIADPLLRAALRRLVPGYLETYPEFNSSRWV